MGRMVAIHLGAAESKVAVMCGASPRLIPTLEGHRATPTIVGFDEAAEPHVGEAASLLAAFEDSTGSVLPIVGLLGRKLDARTAREARRWAPGARLGAAANGDLRVIVGDDALSPPEIAAHLLGYLKAAAEQRLGETVDEAVIAVPAAFDDLQRQATRDAGEIAGLRVARLVNASTAAGLGLGLESRDRRRRVALCHFEGDGFEVSILEIEDGWVRVLATAGAFGNPGASPFESAAGLCRRCLDDARLAPDEIDEVRVAGEARTGPSDLVRRVFGKAPSRASLADGVVLGAALQAGVLQGEVRDLVLLDATSHTLGIETKDGTFTPVIERGSTIPARKRRLFTTIADGQTHVLVHVLQGESDLAAFNQSLHKFDLVEIPWARRGKPQIEVAFAIDVNGATSVEATDRETERRQGIRVHASGGLSRTEVERLARLRLAKPPLRSSSPDERLLSMSRTA